jgi:D-amino-acid dehydrogenase
MYDVIVIGGGVVGLATAYHLVLAGARTLLVDRADAGQATAAGAGIISPETSGVESPAWFALAKAAAQFYPGLVEQLQLDGAGDTGYAPASQLVVAVSDDEDAPFATARQRIFERWRSQPNLAELSEVTAKTAQALFPPLAEVRGALFYRGAARVDGRLLAAALRTAAVARGLAIRASGVDQLVIRDGALSGVVIEGEAAAAGAAVIAGGAWSPSLSAQLGVALPIRPQRGQIIHLSLPEAATRDWPIITAFHGHYMVAWPDSRVVVGATRETGSGFAAHTTAAGVHEVLGEALRVAPGLASARIADIRIGLRPSTPDNLPVLGALPHVRNLFIASGHGANGLTLGPYSGKLIADLARGHTPEQDIGAFGVERFS